MASRPIEKLHAEQFPAPHIWTPEEYLSFEADSDTKHEFIDGQIYDMTGGTSNHSEIAANITIELGIQLRNSECSVRTSDMRVRIGATRYVYPDLSVVCGKGEFEDNSTTLLNPTLVFEVTSPSSLLYDRAAKLEYYSSVPSVQVYIVVDQKRVFIETHTRGDVDWLRQSFSNLGDVIPLPMLDCELPLAQVYRGIDFSED